MKVMVVGAGGIGSYLAHHIDHLIELDQIHDLSFTFYDNDIVELKNILYQNFESSDIDSLKTKALSLKYFNVEFEDKRLGKADLKEAGLVVLCADNNLIRRQTWENFKENGTRFIDSRANGRAIGIFSSDTENYEATLSKDDKTSSCQNPFQIAKKEIEYGNVVIASMLAQSILNFNRNNKLPIDFTTML